MKNRLELARKLLREDGSIWISLDDNEVYYCKILCDEIFGRKCFKANFIWQHRKSSQNDIDVSLSHNYTLCYGKSEKLILNSLGIDEAKFSNPDNDPRGSWVADPFDAPHIRPNLTYPVTNPNTGDQHLPPSGRCWRISQEKFANALDDNRIVWGKNGKGRPQLKRFLSEAREKGKNTFTIWSDIETATDATKNLMKIFDTKDVFTTSKPEELIERVLNLATDEGDLVLDFHLGSGTTAAVAHKMGRQYIGIEQMDYIETVSIERLKKVIEGEHGGVSKSQNWTGGGSFVYCELAKQNAAFINKINSCKTDKEISAVIEEILKSDFVSSKVFPSEISTETKAFAELSFDDKKKFAIALLDKNLLYVNKSDMNDEDNCLSQSDKEFTKSFYKTN